MIRHIEWLNELMIAGIRDMLYYTTACDLQVANDVKWDLFFSDLSLESQIT